MSIGLKIGPVKPNYLLTFHKDGKQVGTFDFNEGAMHFEGDLTESGKVFVDWVISGFQQRINDAVAAEREACAKVCETFYNHEAKDCAEAIRARGQDPMPLFDDWPGGWDQCPPCNQGRDCPNA